MSEPKISTAPSSSAEAPTRLEAFLDDHAKKVVIALVLILGLVAALVARNLLAQQREVRAGEALVAAADNEDLRAVVAEFADTPAAGSALIKLGENQLSANDPAAAAESFRRMFDEFPRHDMAAQARLGLAAALLAQGEEDAAIGELDTLFSRHRDSHLAPLALLKKGEILETRGDIDEARAIYEQVTLDFPDSSFVGQAESMLTRAGFIPPREVEPPPVEEEEWDTSGSPMDFDITVPQLGTTTTTPGINVDLGDGEAEEEPADENGTDSPGGEDEPEDEPANEPADEDTEDTE